LAHFDLVFLLKLVVFFTRRVIECVMVSLEQSTSWKVDARTREGGTFPPVIGGSVIVYENICRFAGGALAGDKLCGSRDYNWVDSSRGH
jgi:hypothetical protein